jgi:acetyltransferase-like isoleucine patch superfamily enzyme
MDLAPVVLFVYNRPWHTEQTLKALAKNELANQSVLFVYSDGVKENAAEEQVERVREVRKLVLSKQWCKEVHIIESLTNKGLAESIITGVTEVVQKYGRIIVLEDDIISSKGFLRFMNDALDIYESENRVMHITGFMYPHRNKKLPETFFYPLPYPGGGWATWNRAWNYFNNDHHFLYNYFDRNKLWRKFNTASGKYLQYQLEQNIAGTMKTWFIKWHACLIMQGGLTLFPNKSLIHNSGFDGSGEHCGTSSVFNGEIIERVHVEKTHITSSKLAKKIIFDFYRKQRKRSIKSYVKAAIPKGLILRIQSLTYGIFKIGIPELKTLQRNIDWNYLVSENLNTHLTNKVKIYSPFKVFDSIIGDYTYISPNSKISYTEIGKFCSIGPNFLSGWGIHPTNGISTSPIFYSTLKQCGVTLSEANKIIERKPIKIGNDVFIGANVTVLDGVTIGDGAIIGAGAVVSKNLPPYSISVGSPIQILRFRFTEKQISKLQKIKWWDFNEDQLKDVEKLFFDIDKFIERYEIE